MKHDSCAITSSNSDDKDPIINVEGKSIPFLNSEKSLLECLEKENIEVHYHCRDGYCGACRVTLNTGEICYPNGEPLAYVGPNEILPCCCMPVSDLSLTID